MHENIQHFMLTLEHKQMFKQTFEGSMQPSNVKHNIRNVYASLHNGICAVLVSYVSGKKVIFNC